ncbi:putative General secretion pathway protein L, GspL [Bradyrhizobium sp. ORS 285]|uniref:PilN domain-containing protein n=1 Tax=Bradyrhizobium sp. ORS 285 TaxID=115808 RepID=UPI0002407969|nr:PilN domain-containing protein [Bradyrhizobium sp. ORS 285]CCD89630.1 putative General secretion pathway protein L, GspL [Bradyrhizobium sp. ORS 285]SMX56309.1 putative General secretion pathway protein L, GspL [Bradyrhizobium sp. ORS 285]
MKVTESIEHGLTAWTASVAAAIEAVADRQLRRPQVRVTYQGPDNVALWVQAPTGKSEVQRIVVNLAKGEARAALSPEWSRILRGSAMEIHLSSTNVLVRPLDFPKQAEPFLDGMIRTQIGRFTPWTLDQALYGFSAPRTADNERITLTLAATPRALVQPLLAFADAAGAAKIVVFAEDVLNGGAPIQIFKASLRSSLAGGQDLGRLLKLGWLAVAAATAVLLVATTLIGGYLDGERDDAQAQVARLRAALRPAIGASAADGLLAKRKQSSPASVIVLETLSKILPDGTYVMEMHVENDRLQISGLTQDAPALIRLIEQSPQFSCATFYAPTTRTAGEAGERFHIEARINAYFGDRA